MPRILEAKLKREYPNNPHAVYGTMNKIGAMKGNKETAKGKAIEKKMAHGKNCCGDHSRHSELGCCSEGK